ncbi:DUF4260 family protein [Tabrizicola sp.]|uniref:DUF4260 family protein n=1 Tax=Tabrizicola sp. TaxID=2005166 RepID=UPI003F40FC64
MIYPARTSWRPRNGFGRTFRARRLSNSQILRREGQRRRACTMDTISWQRLEGAGVCLSALGLFVFLGDGIVWWQAAVVFFAPDISFAGYLAGPRHVPQLFLWRTRQ